LQRTAESDEARLGRIRSRESDLAEMIINGKLTLKGAEEELAERDRVDREARDHARPH
jgi:hypothetical protein